MAEQSRLKVGSEALELATLCDGDLEWIVECPVALLTRIFSVDPSVEPGRALHAITFLWLDGRVWLRVYRIQYADDGTVLDVAEIGPRTVLCPVRIIASGFGGAILHEPR